MPRRLVPLLLLLALACRPEAVRPEPRGSDADAGPPVPAVSCAADDECVVARDCCTWFAARRDAPPPAPCPAAPVCTGGAMPMPAGAACVDGACVAVYAPTNVAAPADLACAQDADCTVVARCCGPRVAARSASLPVEDCAKADCPLVKRAAPARVVCRAGWCVGLPGRR